MTECAGGVHLRKFPEDKEWTEFPHDNSCNSCWRCEWAYPDLTVDISFNPNKSWVRPDRKNQPGLWDHEIGHLRIAKWIGSRMQMALRRVIGHGISCDKGSAQRFARDRWKAQFEPLQKAWEATAEAWQNAYEGQTENGTNPGNQAAWNKIIQDFSGGPKWLEPPKPPIVK
jgi:hypothetical protein